MRIKWVLFVIVFAGSLHGEPMKTPQRLWTSLNHRIMNHPGDYPFTTDMTFKKYADHTIDQTTAYFDPDLVKKGDTIYLTDWYIPWFVERVHPKIKDPYILISNDSDGWHPDSGTWFYDDAYGTPPPVHATRTLLYDSKVAVWFCKNMVISRHPKIIQIPMGPNIIYWASLTPEFFSLVKQGNFEKKHLLYMNMQLESHHTRPRVAALFQNQPYCFSRISGLQHKTIGKQEFYEELSQSMFTVAPPGYGPDTVRFWEAILLDCIPIVEHTEFDDLYADLPVLTVMNWEEVNEDLLKRKYLEIKQKNFSKEKACYDYWARLIKEYQSKVRKDENGFSQLNATRFDGQTLEILAGLIRDSALPGEKLVCRGAVMTLRPFELVEKCDFISRFYVWDEWGSWSHEWAINHLEHFTNHPLLSHWQKITSVTFYDDAYAFFSQSPDLKAHTFLDLSYLRHKLNGYLDNAYDKSLPTALVCGNMAGDAYVEEVLDRFSKRRNVQIQFIGDIWYFKR